MACVDLTDISQQLEVGGLGGLCPVCERVNLPLATAKVCASELPDHFHVGLVEDILAKRAACPGCRLINSTIATCSSQWLAQTTGVIVEQRTFHGVHRAEYAPRPGTIVHTHIGRALEVVVHDSGHSATAGTILRAEEAAPSATNFSPEEASRVRGRIIPPHIDINTLKTWLQYCDVHHASCRVSNEGPAEAYPIRLIDLQLGKVVGATTKEKYVALSYVWGQQTVPLLTLDTLAHYYSPGGLESSAMPRTMSDAMHLVRSIGMRYLWIDSLCILQDDEDDKQSQLAIMDQIYRCSSLLIVAAAGDSADAGLPGLHESTRKAWQCIESIDGIEFISAQPGVQGAIARSCWNSRGWTLQEAALSRRALVFTEHQVYWSCQLDGWREDRTIESSLYSLRLEAGDSLWGSLMDPRRARCRTNLYCWHVEHFSRRRFTEQGDVLWAFNGILKRLRPRFVDGFIWALPYERLDAVLLWTEQSRCGHSHPRRDLVTVDEDGLHAFPYPSWCWLSTTGEASFKDTCGDSIVSEVEWHKPIGYTRAAAEFAIDHEELISRVQSQRPSTWRMQATDYGLLRLTARTAPLVVRRMTATADEERVSMPDRAVCRASVTSTRGDPIGHIMVSESFLGSNPERTGDFILLSSNAEDDCDDFCKEDPLDKLDNGCIKHVPECKHIRSRNVMLIQWTHGIARRVGITTIELAAWAEVQTTPREIILG